MAKIRTREECLSAIQADSASRKREIVALRTSVDAAGELQPMLRRASVVMIYAHWEGFVKQSSLIYIDFINNLIQRRQIQLCSHFQRLMTWVCFRRKGDHPFLRNPGPMIETLKSDFGAYETIPIELIDTEDNLKSKVLKKISAIIDIDYDSFVTREKLIDNTLLAFRNKIAHGERVSISYDDYSEIDREIRILIEEFKDKIEANIQNESYRLRLRYEG